MTPSPNLSKLCGAPDPDTADRIVATLMVNEIEAEWHGGKRQAGLLTAWDITVYASPAEHERALELLREDGIDVTSQDYRWQLAGYPGGTQHWESFKRRTRWALLGLALAFIVFLIVNRLVAA